MKLYQIENTDIIFTSLKRAKEWLKMNNREENVLCFLNIVYHRKK